MDLTPPSLTRSPASPPNTYCPSETSSVDYQSPILIDQHYKISSLYGAGQSCSMAQGLDSETSLPPLDSMTPADWTSPTGMAPISSSSAVPNILSPDYDPFANYESSLPTSYGHEAYPPPPLHGSVVINSSHTGTDITGRSTAPPSSRNSVSFAHGGHIPNPLAPRVKMESTGEYSPGVEVSHYPSPRSLQAPYGADSGSYSNTPATYLGDGSHAQGWPKPEFEVDQFYHSSASQTSAYAHDSRRQFRLARPRRAPRRLTTREEANFQCDVKGCGKLFSRSYNFKAHMETHDEKREYPFPCSIGDCNKKFVRKTDLQRHHQSVHMKERNHKCDYCGRLFARKDTLRRHMEDGCSKRFDIGTLDLRAEGYETAMPVSRSAATGTMSHMMHPAGSLPPLSMPASGNNGFLAATSPAMRNRGVIGGPGQSGHVHHWPR